MSTKISYLIVKYKTKYKIINTIVIIEKILTKVFFFLLLSFPIKVSKIATPAYKTHTMKNNHTTNGFKSLVKSLIKIKQIDIAKDTTQIKGNTIYAL